MAVYVDNFRARYGRMRMSHMVADDRDELLAMADRIGVDRTWIQDYGTHREHFDVCDRARRDALAAGAIEVTIKGLAVILRRKRDARAALARQVETDDGHC